MKKIAGWVMFAVGTLVALALFSAAGYIFIASTFWGGEEAGGGQALGLVPALLGIPFYYLARSGWRLVHKAGQAHQTLAQALGEGGTNDQLKPRSDPTESVLAAIDVVSDKALVFTTKRVIVACLGDQLPAWTIPLSLFAPNNVLSSKARLVKKLRPDQILAGDPFNYAIAYSGIQSVRILKRPLGRKIAIVAEGSAVKANSPFTDRLGKGPENSRRFEFWLSWPWRWGKYASDLRPILSGKLEVPQ